MYETRRSFSFQAAHRLPHHNGKCARVHGHSYEVTVIARSPNLKTHGPATGMVIDFGTMDEIVQPEIDKLEHQMLNEQIDNPTSERICREIYDRIINDTRWDDVVVRAVEVSETGRSSARFTGGTR